MVLRRHTAEGAQTAAERQRDVGETAVGERRATEIDDAGRRAEVERQAGERRQDRRLSSDEWQQSASHCGIEAGRAAGLHQAGLTGCIGEIVGDQAVGVGRIVVAEGKIVLQPQLLVHVEAADQPIEPVVERRTLQAQFLRKGAEAGRCAATAIAIKQVEIVKIGVLAPNIQVRAVGGDRGQLGAAEVIIDFARHAIIGDVAVIVAARRKRGLAIIRMVVDDRTKPALDPGDGRRRVEAGRRAGRVIIAIREIDRAAALLVALRIIADDPDRQAVARLEQQLAANQVAIAIVEVAARDDVGQETVALEIDAVDPGSDRIGDCAGNAEVDAAQVVIADRRFAISLGGELRLGGDDVDQARRCVAAEQGALRPAQHFDPVDRPKLGQAGADAAAIDAVDKHRDRAFEAGVVTNRADAANTGAAGAGFRRGGGDQQRRADLVEAADVDRARIFQRVGGNRGHRERDIAQRFAAAGRGNDDRAVILVSNHFGGVGLVNRRRRDGRSGRGRLVSRLSESRG